MYNELNTKVNNLKNPDKSTLIQKNQYNADKQNFEKKVGDVVSKIPDISSLVTTTILIIKIGEIESKIPDTSSLVTATILNTKTGEVNNKFPDHAKYITTPEIHKFAGSIFDTKLKQANLATNNDANTVEQHPNKNKEKIEKLQTFDLSYFLLNKFFVDDGFQNTFVYQPAINTLELKEDKELTCYWWEIKRGIYF